MKDIKCAVRPAPPLEIKYIFYRFPSSLRAVTYNTSVKRHNNSPNVGRSKESIHIKFRFFVKKLDPLFTTVLELVLSLLHLQS